MIIREHYLEKIRPFLGKPVVKAITGMRRVGKSVFVRQIMELLSTEGVAPDAIVYVDMESLEYDFIRDYRALNDHVIARSAHVSGKIHVLIDEVQDISEWERAVASWSGQPDRYDVTITGSNSTLLSGELASKLTGRDVEIVLYPLSLREFRDFYPEVSTPEQLFQLYLRYGGMPGLRILDTLSDDTALLFLNGIHDSIVLKDIVRRQNIRNAALLDAICNFAYDNIANPLTASRISAYLKSQQLKTNVQSVINYLRALEDAQLFSKVPRYDIKGKKYLEINNKFYASDVGLRHARVGFRAGDIAQLIENLVYAELCRRHDRVCSGEIDRYEVDFVAIKSSEPHYYQVTTAMDDPATRARETRSLLAIPDNYPKTVISLAPVYGDRVQGIEVVSLLDFLLNPAVDQESDRY